MKEQAANAKTITKLMFRLLPIQIVPGLNVLAIRT